MDIKILDLDGYHVQKTISKFPPSINKVISKIYEDLANGNTRMKTRGNFWDIHEMSSVHDNYDSESVQVAVCYDEDDFSERLEYFFSLSKIADENTDLELFFFSTQWNSKTIRKYEDIIESIRKNGSIVNMIYLTSKGICLMPV